ncbi:MAG: efflux RND transporter periplasmic adaptor subunit [Xanthomonadales bacterium]|nr:efflux RND transporter periplasmic adaptor subunit [Xanthomonadales bacterium]
MKRLLAVLLLAAASVQAQDWVTVEVDDRPITVDATGIVASAGAMRFGPPPSRSWRITITKLAREGSRVKAGEVLAQFDGSATDDRVRSLTGDLNAKKSELESLGETQAREIEEGRVQLAAAKSSAEKAARKADVSAELYASLEYQKLLQEKAVAKVLYEQEQRRTELVAQVREAKRAELEADVRRLESELAGAKKELDSFTIRAPRDGLVIVGTDREGQKLDVNDAVNPGIVVVELAREDDLMIQAEVPEYAAASLHTGQKARVVIEAAGGVDVIGEVTAVASIVRRQSQYSQAMVRDVDVNIPSAAAGRLRPGMTAKITIEVDVETSALAIPDEAIAYRDGKPGVNVRGDGWRPVVLGRASAGMHVVSSGLSAGDQVEMR